MTATAQLTDFLKSGLQFSVDLLTEIPSDTNTANWKVCNWDGYTSTQASVEILSDSTPDGVVGRVSTHWRCNSGGWNIVAVGFSYLGMSLGVFVLELNDLTFVAKNYDFTVDVLLVFNNWIPA